MCKLLNFILALSRVPKKFWRHCWIIFCFSLLWIVGETVIEALHECGFIDHYVLIEICSHGVLIAGIAWGVWRAYVGMVRDMDFYDETWFQ